MIVRDLRFCFMYTTLGLMSKCLGKKWGKLWKASKCRFLDTLTQKIHCLCHCPQCHCFDNELEKWESMIWIWSLASVNVCFKPDFKFSNSTVQMWFSGKVCPKTYIFKLFKTYPTFFPDIWTSIPEFYTPNKTWDLLLSSPKIWAWSVNQCQR